MNDQFGIVFNHPESFGKVVYEPVPLRYKVALAARNGAVVTAIIGAAWIALTVAPVEFLTAAIPSFLVSLVIVLRK